MGNDYEENHFFKFNEMYPGHQFACLEKLKKCKLPLLHYNDKIPDVNSVRLVMNLGKTMSIIIQPIYKMNMLPRCYYFFPILR